MFIITDVSSRFGTKLALNLLRSGQKVRGIGNHRENLAHLKSEGMEIATGEITDPLFLSSAFKDAQTLILIALLLHIWKISETLPTGRLCRMQSDKRFKNQHCFFPLQHGCRANLRSWFNPGASRYRAATGLP
jgi:hypothetical protein